jgi:hypothetical protein
MILFDPIFQGLAISLAAGEVASLLLSRMAVPVLYAMARGRQRVGAEELDPGRPETSAEQRPELALVSNDRSPGVAALR